MLWLWTFGYILQEITGNKTLVPLYIYGGLAGALAYAWLLIFLHRLKPV